MKPIFIVLVELNDVYGRVIGEEKEKRGVGKEVRAKG